uniref:Uncharacterized protein n=1 Tax=Salix viminalis TaxID=40686 RepID=A0A6N2L7E5_SALVM
MTTISKKKENKISNGQKIKKRAPVTASPFPSNPIYTLLLPILFLPLSIPILTSHHKTRPTNIIIGFLHRKEGRPAFESKYLIWFCYLFSGKGFEIE